MAEPDARSLSIVRTTAVLLLVFVAAEIAVVWGGATFGISRYLYLRVDLPGLVIASGLVLLAAFGARFVPAGLVARIAQPDTWRIGPWHMALAALVLTAIGVHLVYIGYALSMDEWMTRLQAEIFGSGQLSGVVPEAWREFGRAMYYVFAAYDPASGRVASDYRPGMAALYALFDTVGLGLYTSAILNALSIPLVAMVSLRLWPGRRDIAVLAAFIVFTSQQALAMAMTSYAMTAHMFFNLLWILAFLRKEWWGPVAVVLIGGFTAALHQIHVHAFFAAPFFLLLLRPFRFRLLAFYAIGYATTHALVFSWDWWSIGRYLTASGAESRSLVERVLRIARLPSLDDLLTVFANLVRMIAWQNLALLPLIAGAGRALVADKWLRILGASVICSLLPYVFLMPDQGHGWGYRYLHGLIGPLALIGAYGGARLLRARIAGKSTGFLALLTLSSMLVMVPVRGLQIRDQVRPFALATGFAGAQETDVVIIDDYLIPIGTDIPRNSAVDPKLPIQFALTALTPEQIAALCLRHDIRYLGPEAFPADIGLGAYPDDVSVFEKEHEARLAALRSDACAGKALPSP